MPTLFDHLKRVYEGPSDYWDTLTDDDKKSYSSYMINRLVSMTPEYIELANAAQMFGTLDSRESFLFYSNILPQRNPWSKYIKAAKDDAKYPEWLIGVVTKYYHVSTHEAIEYLALYYKTDVGKAELRELCEAHAIDPKLIKKAKL
jgi:Bacteriophage clamp loader A subunit